MKNDNKKKRILGVPRRRFLAYSFLIGIAFIFIIIFLVLHVKFQNLIINFCLNIFGSLFVTVIFGYIIDLISQREVIEFEKSKRIFYIQPIVEKINNLIAQVILLNNKNKTLKCENIQLDYFKSAMKNLYSKYFEYLEKLTDKQKTLPEEKKAFAIKSAIEKWLKEIIKSIDTILNNAQNDMIVSHLLNNMEKLELKTLRDTANELHLPYLDIINFDKNGQIIKYDWPKNNPPIDDRVKGNYITSICLFVSIINTLMKNVNEFKFIGNIKFKTLTIPLDPNKLIVYDRVIKIE